MRRLAILMLIAMLTSACASTGAIPSRAAHNTLTLDDLSRTKAYTAYQAVERLRPEFLRTRGPSTILNHTSYDVAVFVDHMLMGGVDVLRSIPIHEVMEIRYLKAWDATTKYGTGYMHGVIEVTTTH